MELRIGENIKILRRRNGMTQENLAELLNISSAAVSKWESGCTYPDITAIIPLAQIFDVTIDELMGFDSDRVKAQVAQAIASYQKLRIDGKYDEASRLITDTRASYPNDFQVMSLYLQDAVGSGRDLSDQHEELMQICDCILGSCTDESIRLKAISAKAKLYHAAGNTAAALDTLKPLPTWDFTANMQTEQLFTKGSAEYHEWVQRNLYALTDVTSNKLVRSIWYDTAVSEADRMTRCESIGDMVADLRQKSGETAFAIMEHMLFAELSNRLAAANASPEALIRVLEKRLHAAAAVTEKAKNDPILRELLNKTYQTDDLLRWSVDWLKTAAHPPLAALRNHEKYMTMLSKF